MQLANDIRRVPLLRGSLAALALLAAAGCTTSVKPPPLPPSPTSSTAASGAVVPASFVLPDGTKVHTGQCGAG